MYWVMLHWNNIFGEKGKSVHTEFFVGPTRAVRAYEHALMSSYEQMLNCSSHKSYPALF